MKKIILSTLLLISIVFNFYTLAEAKTKTKTKKSNTSSRVKIAVRKYKAGNYTGCLQDCLGIVQKHPNSIAYYYIAMSYAQAGKKDLAIQYYSKTLAYTKDDRLIEYAETGKRCLENPSKCRPDSTEADENDLDKFVRTNTRNLSDSVKNDFQQKRLKNIMQEINNGKELDDYNFKDFRDYSKNKSNIESDNRIAYTDQEIQEALKILNESGYSKPQTQTETMTPELLQVKSMLENSNRNNSMLNQSVSGKSDTDMLQYMLTQGKDSAEKISPQVLQSIIMNSMQMNEFNYNLDSNR